MWRKIVRKVFFWEHSPGTPAIDARITGWGGGGDTDDSDSGEPAVLDRDGDGVELVALEDSTALYDIDGDGRLDALDVEWGRFRVWRDLARTVRATRGRFRRLPRWGSRRVEVP